MMRIPVPKKNEDAIEMPNCLRNTTFRKVYRLAQPRLMIILLRIAMISDAAFADNSGPVKGPAVTAPSS